MVLVFKFQLTCVPLKSKTFKINHIKLRLIRVNLGNDTFKFFKRHVFLLGMFIRQRIQRDG